MKFVDEIEIKVRAGKGGAGCVSFLHAKYLEHGGPDGGDGGRGGDVCLSANSSVQSLGHLMSRREVLAPNGNPGRGTKKSGSNGESVTIHLPVGTEVINKDTNQVVCDLNHPEISHIVAAGGLGGRGNYHFATSTNQTPEYAQPGLPGEQITLVLKLKLLADAGLVGLPNAGKSTLLGAVTKKLPRIADYAFTTLSPNIGVVEFEENYLPRRLLLADIPGIIEGASKGVGLGLSFLRHIERVKLIVYVLDGTNLNALSEIQVLQNELRSYSAELLKRPALIVVNKLDQFDFDAALAKESMQGALKADIWAESGQIPDVCYLSAKEGKELEPFIKKMFSWFPKDTLAEMSIKKEAPESSQNTGDTSGEYIHITH